MFTIAHRSHSLLQTDPVVFLLVERLEVSGKMVKPTVSSLGFGGFGMFGCGISKIQCLTSSKKGEIYIDLSWYIMIYIYIYTMMYQYLNKNIIYDLFGFYITYLGFKHGFWSNWNGECDKSTTACRLGCSPTSTVGYWVSCCRFGNVTIPSFTVKGVWTTEMYRHVKKCIEMWYMGMRIDQIWWYHIVACFPFCLQNHPFAHHVPICPNKKGRQFFPSRGHGTYTSKQFMAQKFRRKMFSQNWENWEFSPKHTTISTIMADHLFNIAKIH